MRVRGCARAGWWLVAAALTPILGTQHTTQSKEERGSNAPPTRERAGGRVSAAQAHGKHGPNNPGRSRPPGPSRASRPGPTQRHSTADVSSASDSRRCRGNGRGAPGLPTQLLSPSWASFLNGCRSAACEGGEYLAAAASAARSVALRMSISRWISSRSSCAAINAARRGGQRGRWSSGCCKRAASPAGSSVEATARSCVAPWTSGGWCRCTHPTRTPAGWRPQGSSWLTCAWLPEPWGWRRVWPQCLSGNTSS